MGRINGTDGRDRLVGSDAADEFYAGAGNDSIKGFGGDDVIHAGDGKDTAQGGDGDDAIFGEGGDDRLTGKGGDDTLDGGEGDDLLRGNVGHDQLFGGGGDDVLVSGGAFDSRGDLLDGGAGNDLLSFYRSVGGGEEPYVGHGGDGDDTIEFSQATGGEFQFFGDGGNDALNIYDLTDGLADGGDGLDFVTDIFLRDGAAVTGETIDLSPLWATGEVTFGTLTLRDIEQIGDFRAGDYFGATSHSVIVGDMPGAGNEQRFRLFMGGGDDHAYGGSADEYLFGEGGGDLLSAGAGKDYLDGGAGDDQLFGSDGDDTIFGGDGNDRITGGSGVDRMSGIDEFGRRQSGNDLFIFRSGDTGATLATADTIVHFFAGDQISLKLIDANATTAANDAFTFIGSAAFGGVAGELRFADGVIAGDTDGDRVADLMIKVEGNPTLVAADFQL